MAIDTTTKKLSLFDLGCPWRRTLPVGDGSFSTGDKQHFIFLYSGIAATSSVDLSPFCIAAFGFQIAGSVKSGFQIAGSVKPGFQIAGSVASQEGCG